jgi:peptidoglycan/xylan/chitin deacetylase (PgdA/CDA1 family)
MSSDQLNEFTAFGMSVQCHGKRHILLKGLSKHDLYQELVVSKRTIENLIGTAVHYMSFPGGSFDKNVVACVRDAGYQAVMCSIPFYLYQVDGFFVVGRHMIKHARKSNFSECLKVNHIAHARAYFLNGFKRSLKTFIGNKVYYWLWKIYAKRSFDR